MAAISTIDSSGATDARLFGGIEAGGTKFVCGVGTADGGSRETVTIPTRDPDATFADVTAFFHSVSHRDRLASIGIGSFGPIDLDPRSPSFGQILHTPKPHWAGTDFVRRMETSTGLPVALDTDVNAAAMAEVAMTGNTVSSLAYVTVGTGIGVGIVVDGAPLHGLGHPEAGHIRPRRHPAHAGFAGTCPFHGDCLEGLASGPAITAAWGLSADHMPDDHPFWAAQADYLAQLCATLFLTVAPERIVLGGGVMKQQRLFAPIRARTAALLGGYVAGMPDAVAAERRIVPPACIEPSGLIGAYLLAERLLAART